jgi:DNA-binding GntR family transcriptional regulator
VKNTDIFTKENFSDKLVKIIRANIVHGEYKSGQILRETQLSKEWDVSRTPVREALKALEQQQLLVRLSNGSYQVTELTIEYVGHFYDTLRVLMDFLISHSLIFDLSEKDKRWVAKMISALEKSIQKSDLDAYIKATADLILFMIQKTGNPIIEKIAHELIPIGSRIMWTAITNAPDIPERLMKDVIKIYEKILQKNSQEAVVLFHSAFLLIKEMTIEKLSSEKANQ